MPRLEPEVGPPAVTFIISLIATLGGMVLIFGFPEGMGDSLSHTTFGYFCEIGIIALPLLIMLGSFLWLIVALVLRSRPAH